MDRRKYLRISSVALSSIAFAGCSEDNSQDGETSDCTISESIGGAPAFAVSADGRFDNADAVLDLQWNARTQNSIKQNPDSTFGSESDVDATFLTFRVEVTNTADDVVTIDTFNFELDYKTPNITDTAGTSIIFGIDQFNAQIRPGGTVDDLLVFTLPENTTSATLQPAEANFPDRKRVAFRPSCDDSLPISAPELN